MSRQYAWIANCITANKDVPRCALDVDVDVDVDVTEIGGERRKKSDEEREGMLPIMSSGDSGSMVNIHYL